MVNYENILNIFSLILILLIFFVIIFGCNYKGCKYYENFENNNKINNKDNSIKKEEKEKKEEFKDDNNDLSSFEHTVLKGLSDGSLTTEGLTNLIKEEKFTPTNLNNLINYVEKFNGNFNNN